MQHVETCLVCGQKNFEWLLRYAHDGYFQKIPGLATQKVQYWICRNCGFVCQRPTLTDTELESLYATEYRNEDPPDRYQRDQRRLGERLVEYVETHIGKALSGRRVLDIGCAAGLFLEKFERHGWEGIGIDANARWTAWGRTHLGLDLRNGFFDAQALPGERFSLILFSHVLEHLPNPFPTLSAIRHHLSEGGFLLLGAPNLCRPHLPVMGNMFAGPHVCLYSSRTIVPLLEQAGFEVAFQDNWYPRGLRVLAKASRTVRSSIARNRDNWRVILKLYAGLLKPDTHDHFARNLASLVPAHMDILEELTRHDVLLHHRLVPQKDGSVVLQIRTPSGYVPLLPTASSNPSRLHADDSVVPGIPYGHLIVQVGIGSGEFALSLLSQLEERDQRLLICEPDPAVVLALFKNRDLRGLLASERVRVVTGSQIYLTRGFRRWIRPGSPFIVLTDPAISERWGRRYGPVKEYFQSGTWQDRHVSGWKFSFAA